MDCVDTLVSFRDFYIALGGGVDSYDTKLFECYNLKKSRLCVTCLSRIVRIHCRT